MIKAFSQIVVKFQKEGIHCYPAALEDPSLSEVSFLGHPHRHIFHFKVAIQIFHEDRELEFILVKRWLESLYSDSILQLDYKSCEMISDELAEVIEKKYPNRMITIEIFEDNENGSVTVYTPRGTSCLNS